MAAMAAGAIVGGVLSVGSALDSKRSAKYMKRAQKQRAKITAIKNQQKRAEFMRNFRRAQADAVGVGVAVGMESSAALASTANVNTRGAQAIEQGNRIAKLDRNAQFYERRAGEFAADAATLGAFAGTAFSLGSSFSSLT